MSDQLQDSAERLFATHAGKAVLKAAEDGQFPTALWAAVEETGFTAALLPEDAGGFGATPAEALGLLRIAAGHAAPVPLAETMLAASVLARAGLPVPPGPLSLAPVRRGDDVRIAGGTVSGTARRVPWGRDAGLVVLAGGMAAFVPAGRFGVAHAVNLAGEPRDTVTFDGAAVTAAPCPVDPARLRLEGAALRTVQIAGALSRILEICVGYVQTRVQFGRPIGKFQAIQQSMAVLAGQAAAAGAAADMAADAFAAADPVVIAAAKARAGEAASVAAGIAHQVHGAIGFTREYELHPLTRRLWSWRDEFGNEAEWNAAVGRAALRAGADGLWPAITAAA